MNTEDGAKLYDVCPHVSDSVRVGRVGEGLMFLVPLGCGGKGLPSAEL